MAVLVKDKVKVDSNIFTRSKNAVVNCVMEMLLEIIYKRKLDPAELLQLRQILEDAMYVWLHERALNEVILEVSLPDRGDALERWEFVFDYHDNPDETLQKAPTEELGKFCEMLKSLPSGAAYRILARVAPGAKALPGWGAASLKDMNVTNEKHFGKFGYGHINGKVFYRGGVW